MSRSTSYFVAHCMLLYLSAISAELSFSGLAITTGPTPVQISPGEAYTVTGVDSAKYRVNKGQLDLDVSEVTNVIGITMPSEQLQFITTTGGDRPNFGSIRVTGGTPISSSTCPSRFNIDSLNITTSGGTPVTLECVTARTINIRLTGPAAVVLGATVIASKVNVYVGADGPLTVEGDIAEIDVAINAEASVTVKSPAVTITGTSNSEKGKVVFNPAGPSTCSVAAPGPPGSSACEAVELSQAEATDLAVAQAKGTTPEQTPQPALLPASTTAQPNATATDQVELQPAKTDDPSKISSGQEGTTKDTRSTTDNKESEASDQSGKEDDKSSEEGSTPAPAPSKDDTAKPPPPQSETNSAQLPNGVTVQQEGDNANKNTAPQDPGNAATGSASLSMASLVAGLVALMMMLA